MNYLEVFMKNIGLIGCGNIAETYFRSQEYFNNIKFISCADVYEEASKKCAKENIDLSIDGVDRFDELKTIKETELSHISGNIVGKYSDAPTHMAHMKWDDLVKH